MGPQVFLSLQSAGSIPVGAPCTTGLCSFFVPPTSSISQKHLTQPQLSHMGRRDRCSGDWDCRSAFESKAYVVQRATGHHSITCSSQLHWTGEAGPVTLLYMRNGGFSPSVVEIGLSASHTGNCFLVCWDLAIPGLFLLPAEGLLARVEHKGTVTAMWRQHLLSLGQKKWSWCRRCDSHASLASGVMWPFHPCPVLQMSLGS